MTDSSIPEYNKTEKPVAKKKATKKKAPKKKVEAKVKTDTAIVKAGDKGITAQVRNTSERVPLHKRANNHNVENRDPNYSYRDCADYDKGRIQDLLNAGWEFELDDSGEKIVREGKEKLYRMRIPMEYYEQDKLAKRQKIIDTNKQVKADDAPKGGAIPEYHAEEHDVLNR